MNKNQLAQELAVSEKIHLSTAFKAIDGVLRIIKHTLAKGEDVALRGFGTLSPVQREERPGINFTTKEPIVLPAQRSVRFKISQELKNIMNHGNVD
ncbi:MAG: HU family DNA-binding protein [Muribaculaceae bacterium]|nr:HU family DNA-binding protein [Muribaculaceae bacterium]